MAIKAKTCALTRTNDERHGLEGRVFAKQIKGTHVQKCRTVFPWSLRWSQ